MSSIYDKAREAFLSADIDWLSDTIKAVMTTSAYTPDFSTDDVLSDISVGARATATSEAFTDKTATDGWASTDKIEWLTVTGATRVAIVVYQDTGDEATSRLIAYLDDDITNLPLEPTGAKVTFIPDSDTGLFRI